MRLLKYMVVITLLSAIGGYLWSFLEPPASYAMSFLSGFIVGYVGILIYNLRKE